MSDTFYNPYQFLPVTGRVNDQPTPATPFEQIRAAHPDADPIRHDRWLPGAWTGRLLVRLTTKTPTIVGNAQHKPNPNDPAQVTPYLRNGRPAFPGNSLRGMLGAVAEGLSQSALRVLEDRHYSVRKPMGEALSAIGHIVADADGLRLEPLTLPTLTIDKQSHAATVPAKWQRVFADPEFGTCRLGECLPAYVNGYGKLAPDSFLATVQPNSSRVGHDEPWHCALADAPALQQLITAPIVQPDSKLFHTHKAALLGRKISPGRAPQREPGDDTTSGWLRVLGIADRETEMPFGKKHERFIPCPQTPRQPLDFAPGVLERFERLVLERAAQRATGNGTPRQHAPDDDRLGHYPFLPLGYEPYLPSRAQIEGKDGARPWRPVDGMLVHFDVTDEQTPRVSELSFSAIWRAEVPAATPGADGDSTHAFFRALADDAGHTCNLLPWGAAGRDALTPAEALFGVAEELPAAVRADPEHAPARNLAGRLRVQDALPVPDKVAREPETILKTLNSPKPPSPTLYFHPCGQRGTPVRKQQLNRRQHRPNGRKVYLHHPKALNGGETWPRHDENQDNDRLRLIARPVAKGQDFVFPIDFDNLSDAELSLLWQAIEPGAGFLHRLGLGKPLGLGSVELRVEALFHRDPAQRCSAAAVEEQHRWHAVWLAKGANPEDWPVHQHKADRIAARAAGAGELPSIQAPPAVPDLIDAKTLAALCAVGDPGHLDPDVPVSYPLDSDQHKAHQTGEAAAEQDGFNWFMYNEDCIAQPRAKGQALPPLPLDAKTALAPLHALKKCGIEWRPTQWLNRDQALKDLLKELPPAAKPRTASIKRERKKNEPDKWVATLILDGDAARQLEQALEDLALHGSQLTLVKQH